MNATRQATRNERFFSIAASHQLCDLAGIPIPWDLDDGISRVVWHAFVKAIELGITDIAQIRHIAEHADEDPKRAAAALRWLADELDATDIDAAGLADAVDTWLGGAA